VRVLAILVLLGLIAASPTHGQERTTEPGYRSQLGHPRLIAEPQAGGVVIQLQNGGSALATRGGGLVAFNCSTNMSCSFSGSTFTLTASSTASTAWSALTSGTNSNAGTFAASGNTWDFSASALFKQRVGAGLTTSTNGDCGYDSTANRWHCWQGGADRLMIAATNVGAPGQVPISNADGSETFVDPIISFSAPAELTAAWTSATGLNSAVTYTQTGTQGMNTAVVTLNQGSTISGGIITFEVSDTTAFTNAYNASCRQEGTATVASTYALVASTNQAFVCNVGSYAAFRVRLSTVITGTATVNVGVQPSAAVTQPYSVVTQGAPGTTGAQSWPVRINDSAGTVAKVLLGLNTPSGADNSLEVSLNPNGAIPTGSNTIGAVTQSGTWTVQPGNTANTTPWLVQGNLSNNGAAAGANRLGTLPGIAQTDYNNGTATTQGRDVGMNCGTDGLCWVASLPAIRPCSYVAAADFTLSSTTDIAVLPGNASNTVLVTGVQFSGIQTTAGILRVQVVKRSAADTGGTSAPMTVVPEDSNCAAGISAPLTYTGTGPTQGAAVGDVDDARIGLMAAATASPNDIYILNLQQKPIVLRGTAQQLAITLGGAVTGGTGDIKFRWIETKTITP